MAFSLSHIQIYRRIISCYFNFESETANRYITGMEYFMKIKSILLKIFEKINGDEAIFNYLNEHFKSYKTVNYYMNNYYRSCFRQRNR